MDEAKKLMACAPEDLAASIAGKMSSGRSLSVVAIGGGTGPLWVGHLYDRAGAYLPRSIVYLAAVAFGAVILSFFLQSGQESITSERKVTANAGVPLED